ncbi:MAG: type II toxin-antitoxin system prevent-host-death family antitoxin [Nocardiopsaceae bacterium]|nr:type II toxin-antitoxin system prevent-host-death family antitoxin [Nocardiopsaceae bacterium]
MLYYTEEMASVRIRDLNQQTSQILERVRAGETIEITDRGVPFAEIRPLSKEQSVLAHLAAEGMLIPATLDPSILKVLPKGEPDGVNVADWLAADREQERF